jgi:hypothetical protein
MITPAVIAHADWGTAPRKRQLAVATLLPAGFGYKVVSVAPAPTGQPPQGDLFQYLSAAAGRGQAMIGFDFPVGLPVAYAKAAGISSFAEFLDAFASPPPPWREFATVARRRDEITLRRPFYPDRPGGTERQHLYDALGLPAGQLRRRCEGTDAEILFWTLGGKQVGKGALAGWRLLAAARHREPGIALWPFDGRCRDCSTPAAAPWSRKPTPASSTSTSVPRPPRERGGASGGRQIAAPGLAACSDGRNHSPSAGTLAS